MLAIGQQDAVNILRFFDDLPDPRSTVNRLHRLGDVIVIAICAIIATADGPTAIAKWATLNAYWLRRHLALPNGIPGKDTFRRVLGLLPPAVFGRELRQTSRARQAARDHFSSADRWCAPSMNRKYLSPGGEYLNGSRFHSGPWPVPRDPASR